MKKLRIMAATMALTSVASISAYAGAWANNAQGWWYNNGDGTWPVSTWQWIDGNGDGTAECYYFDANGYCLMNTMTPDGYKVNGDGAWLLNGTIQTKSAGNISGSSDHKVSSIADGDYHVSFKQSDIKKNNGQYTMTFTTYTERMFSKAYVMSLKIGDTVEGTKINTMLWRGDTLCINSDSFWFNKVEGSSDLYTFDYEDGYRTWNTVGQYTVPVASDAVFVDELYFYEKGIQKYSFSEFANNSKFFQFGYDADGTGITVKNGAVTEVHRYYMP